MQKLCIKAHLFLPLKCFARTFWVNGRTLILYKENTHDSVSVVSYVISNSNVTS